MRGRSVMRGSPWVWGVEWSSMMCARWRSARAFGLVWEEVECMYREGGACVVEGFDVCEAS